MFFSYIFFSSFLIPCFTINPIPISIIMLFNTMCFFELFVPPFSLKPLSSTFHDFKEDMSTLFSKGQLNFDLISSHRKMTSISIVEWVLVEPLLHLVEQLSYLRSEFSIFILRDTHAIINWLRTLLIFAIVIYLM